MAKNLKINIKNSQLAEALNLKKSKLVKAGKKAPAKKKTASKAKEVETEVEKPKVTARIITKKKKEPLKEAAKTNTTKADAKETKVSKKEKPVKVEKEAKEAKEKSAIAETKIKKAEKIKEPAEKKEAAPSTPASTVEPIETIAKEEKEQPTIKDTKEEKSTAESDSISTKKTLKPTKPKYEKAVKEYKAKRLEQAKKAFDSRDKTGRRTEDDDRWRKKRYFKAQKVKQEIPVVRPTSLSIKLPIMLKDLASAMKLKASELITKLFSQGIAITLNDYLDDETTIQLLGHDFNCEITIDKSTEERIQITADTVQEEIAKTDPSKLKRRNPVITFMGHVDHGKTSIIDSIRKSNIASQEAGAITQHIGAFTAKTSLGELTILDTPGHEAFTEMRARGANVTDIVVLVIAGDEGIREQTVEAMNQAKETKAPIIVAINKSDKEGYDPDKIYRELADHELIPEAWGGTTITVNCSAITGSGINDLLEMISLQSELLELKADPSTRARGTILESQMHKGLGAVATVLVQNGTLHLNDAFVFGSFCGKIKTMHDQHGKAIDKAPPSFPAKITGLSALAEAGSEMIVVKSEKEAKEIAKERAEKHKRAKAQIKKMGSLESLLSKQEEKKNLPLIIRADVQGSLEALENALNKIKSKKASLNIINSAVGEISESDIELAAASKAVILGFHTHIESHAEPLIKLHNIKILQHDIIYHAIDDIKEQMTNLLDKIEEEKNTGKAKVKAVFASSALGKIAGCQMEEGSIKRSDFAKVIRNDEIVWKGKIASLKRMQEDVREVQKGVECGILLEKYSDVQEGDIIQGYQIIYKKQTL